MKDDPNRDSTARVGILLLNSRLRPVHYNSEAAVILGYPNKTQHVPTLDTMLPKSKFPMEGLDQPLGSVALAFMSGRRRYLCRAFQLEVNGHVDRRLQPRVVLVLERQPSSGTEPSWSERFRLTLRECETVRLLLKGLTSKEIAMEMGISPNTVKSFLKLAMIKVGASNRTALIARIIEKTSD